VQTLPRGRR